MAISTTNMNLQTKAPIEKEILIFTPNDQNQFN
jgi:hypothetical protein